MATEKDKDNLPTLEDFTEDSLLDSLEDTDQDDPDNDSDDKHDDDPDKNKGKSDDLDLDLDPDDEDAPDGDLEEKKKKNKSDEDENPDDDEEEEEDPKDKSKSKKKDKKDSDEDDDQDEDEEGETFWSDVEKITGRQIDVDYGDTDPESPEGAAIREEALAQNVINDHLDYLKDLYPREFRALEHAANGGKMEDLYSPSEPDYSKMEIKEDDVDSQKNFLNNYYQKKGFSATKARRLVDADEDSDEGLFKTAKEALKELTVRQEKDRNKVIEEQKNLQKEQKKEDMNVMSTVESIVQSGKLNKFTIPVKERDDFYRFALDHLQRNPNGGYMFVTPMDERKLEGQLQEMFFAYKKGDLSKIVQREAKSENARRLKRNVSKSEKKKTSSEAGSRNKNRKSMPTMDDFNE